MLKPLAVALSIFTLAGCAANDETPPDPPASPAVPAAPASPEASPPVAKGSSAGDGTAASPLAACRGLFGWRYDPSKRVWDGKDDGQSWLRRTEKGCTLDMSTVLAADGTFAQTRLDGTVGSGTWKGDEFYFELTYADAGGTIYYRRLPEQPSDG